jgi:hypothetical protein
LGVPRKLREFLKYPSKRQFSLSTLIRCLIDLTCRQQQTQRTLLDWLRVECGIEKPSSKREEKG